MVALLKGISAQYFNMHSDLDTKLAMARSSWQACSLGVDQTFAQPCEMQQKIVVLSISVIGSEQKKWLSARQLYM